MKTIVERAKEVGMLSQVRSDYLYDKRSVEFGYTQGATEQKAIDDAELLKLKSSWEKQAQINHDDEANYKQGYHDAVEKAKTAFGKVCGWLSTYRWYDEVLKEFLNAIEE